VVSPIPLLADVMITPNRAIHSALANPTSRKPAAEKATARAMRKLEIKIYLLAFTKTRDPLFFKHFPKEVRNFLKRKLGLYSLDPKRKERH